MREWPSSRALRPGSNAERSTQLQHLFKALPKPFRRAAPRVALCSFEARFGELGAQGGIVPQAGHGLRNAFHLERIAVDGSVTGHLGQAGGIGGDHRHAALHRFRHGDAEALEIGHEDKRQRVRQGLVQFGLLQPAGEDHLVRVAHRFPSGLHALVPPEGLAHDH